jgi:hypothetical protein
MREKHGSFIIDKTALCYQINTERMKISGHTFCATFRLNRPARLRIRLVCASMYLVQRI